MKSLKPLLALAIFGCMVYVAYRVVPVYLSTYQFQDAIEEEARLDTYSQKTEQDIKEIVIRKAESLELPVTSEQVKVQKLPNSVMITAEYSVHIDLPVHPLDLSFKANSQNHSAY